MRATVDDDGNPELIGKTSANVVAVYTFEGGRLSTFQWGTSVPDSQPELPPIVEPTGLSTAQAILDVQKNESEGVRWEYRYLAFHPCSNAGAHWQLSKQSLVQDGDRRFDVLHVVCATKTERDFYFDITSFYGKI